MARHRKTWQKQIQTFASALTYDVVRFLKVPHYSLLARFQALQVRIAEHCPWEKALPKLKDPDRQPDPATVRRWARDLSCSDLAVSFVSQIVTRIAHWLERSRQALDESGPLSWITPALQNLWPLRL